MKQYAPYLELVGPANARLASVATLRDGGVVVVRRDIKHLAVAPRPERKAGASVRHVQAHAASVASVGQHAAQRRCHHLCRPVHSPKSVIIAV